MNNPSILTNEDYDQRLVLHKKVHQAVIGKTLEGLPDGVVSEMRDALEVANGDEVGKAKLVIDLVNRNQNLLMRYGSALRYAKYFNEDGSLKSDAPSMPPGLAEAVRPDKAKNEALVRELDVLRPRLELLLSAVTG